MCSEESADGASYDYRMADRESQGDVKQMFGAWCVAWPAMSPTISLRTVANELKLPVRRQATAPRSCGNVHLSPWKARAAFSPPPVRTAELLRNMPVQIIVNKGSEGEASGNKDSAAVVAVLALLAVPADLAATTMASTATGTTQVVRS
jgi:hypothetical protein